MAALSIAIEKARRGATAEARERQNRAELRLEEMSKILGIPERWDRKDNRRNLAVETAFTTAYQLVDSPDEKDAVLKAFMLWEADEKGERIDLRDEARDASDMLGRDNPVFLDGESVPSEWLDGQWVPGNSEGAA